jgi:retinol-binding protein 3
MNNTYKITLCISLFFCLALQAQAQVRPPVKDMSIDAATKNAVIKSLNQEMQKKYVFLHVAKKVETMLQKRQKNGDYEKINSAEAFAKTLTEHLRAVTHDKHLGVDYAVDEIPIANVDAPKNQEETEKNLAEERAFMKSVNFGIEKIERLDGNVGYLELRGFGSTEIVGHAMSAAMTLLNASDALIIDLRRNGGGSPDTVALLVSYFLPAETHLSDIYTRSEDKTQQFWSTSYTAGPRYDKNKKIYVLTSKDTFSAAEDFSYTMQSFKRTTIIGEVSGGGAHPVDGVRLHAHFSAGIPYGRSINPITKTNWEGVGVIPEVKVDAKDALKTAHKLALKALLDVEKHPGKRKQLENALEKMQLVT